MYNEEIIKKLESLQGADRDEIGRALSDLRSGFQKIFNLIMDSELSHDEILQIAEMQLDDVYGNFLTGMESD